VFSQDGVVVLLVEDEYRGCLLHELVGQHSRSVRAQVHPKAFCRSNRRLRRAPAFLRKVTGRRNSSRAPETLAGQTLGEGAATDVAEADKSDRPFSPCMLRAARKSPPDRRKPKPQAPPPRPKRLASDLKRS